MNLSTKQSDVAAQIFDRVAEVTGVTREQMVGPSRENAAVRARWVAMASIRHILGVGTKTIGEMFNRDHATVINACNKVENSPELDDMVMHVCEPLKSRHVPAADPDLAAAMRLILDAQEATNKAIAILHTLKQ